MDEIGSAEAGPNRGAVLSSGYLSERHYLHVSCNDFSAVAAIEWPFSYCRHMIFLHIVGELGIRFITMEVNMQYEPRR